SHMFVYLLSGHQHVVSTSINNVEASSSNSRVPRISGESTRRIDSSSPQLEYKHIGSVQRYC
nr:hypothetical protein [Tanacetum cinerariifolium]